MNRCTIVILIIVAIFIVFLFVIVANYNKQDAMRGLSPEQKEEIIVLREKLFHLSEGDFVERGERLYQFIGLDATNSMSISNRIVLMDDKGNKAFWNLTNPYHAVEHWRRITNIFKKGEPRWKETNTWFHYGTMPLDGVD